MNIKDYLHLYLGQSFRYKYVDSDGWTPWFILSAHDLHQINGMSNSMFQLALRPLSDITDEEMDEVWYGHEPKNVLVMQYKNSGLERKVALCSERTRYLLSKGFDLFGLIDAEIALDKTQLES